MAEYDFYIIWLDREGNTLGDEYVFRQTYEQTLRHAARRIHQSPWRCPPSTGGFYIVDDQTFRSKVLGKELAPKPFDPNEEE